jgi:hypothetical protein
VVDVASLGLGAGLVSTAILVLHRLLLAVIAIWSLRADEAGRQHAIRLIEALQIFRLPRKPTNSGDGPPLLKAGDP